MFGMSGTELVIILVLALLLLGPDKLPEVAKLVGKGMRDFQKATDDVRSTVESELYKLEQQADPQTPPASTAVVAAEPVPAAQPSILPPAAGAAPGSDADLGGKVVSLESWAGKPDGNAKS